MPSPEKTVVVALGGNAISLPGEVGTIDEQFAHTAQTAEALCAVVESGHRLVVTHGNGPQVGNVLRRVELSSRQMYPLPLEVCVADTQAGMGYMIAQCLSNSLERHGLHRPVTAVVTTVLVDRDDPAFGRPTKPIGMRMKAELAEAHRANDGWNIREVGKGWYRRIVPSPKPLKIQELPAIAELMRAGQIVVACGGGGIPVVEDERGNVRGTAAVIDKDRTSALLALGLDADTLVILTAVDHAYLNYGKPDQRALEQLTTADANRLLADGQFAEGSMGPKIESAVEFVTQSPHAHATAIITQLDNLSDALDGNAGTRIVC